MEKSKQESKKGGKGEEENNVIIIKKYANRRLYCVEKSGYVTLSYINELIHKNRDFKVIDAKTQEDLTNTVLMQIILDKEGNGSPMLPTALLKQIISFYGNSYKQLFFWRFLEVMVDNYLASQQQIEEYFTQLFGQMSPFDMMPQTLDENASALWFKNMLQGMGSGNDNPFLKFMQSMQEAQGMGGGNDNPFLKFMQSMQEAQGMGVGNDNPFLKAMQSMQEAQGMGVGNNPFLTFMQNMQNKQTDDDK